MTCRVARSFQNHTQIELASGSTNLEMCSTSKVLGSHLRPIFAQSMVERGAAEDSKAQSSNVTTNEGVECVHFSAPNVAAAVIDSNMNHITQIRQPSLPDWRCVVQTTIALLVIGVVAPLVLLWLMMFILWSVTTQLSIKVWRQRNLFRFGFLLIGSGMRTSNEPRKSRLFWL